MKKIGLLVFVFALVTGVIVTNIFSFGRVTGNMFNFNFDWKGVRGSGNVVTESRDVSGFHGIGVGGISRSRSSQKETSASWSRLTTTSCRLSRPESTATC